MELYLILFVVFVYLFVHQSDSEKNRAKFDPSLIRITGYFVFWLILLVSESLKKYSKTYSPIIFWGCILLFIYSDTNRIRLYGVIMLAYTLFNCLSYYLYCRRNHYDVIRFRLNKDQALYKEMVSFSGWTMFGAFANVGKSQGCAIIINFFFGTLVNAACAIAHQVETFIMMFARSLGSAAVPQTTKSFSAGDIQRSITLTSHISKYTFI